MHYAMPTEAEIQAAMVKVGIRQVEPMCHVDVAQNDVVPRTVDGRRDWSAELVELRALVEQLPHDVAPGTPSTAAARHYVDVGHRIAHGCCPPPATL